MFSRLRSFSIEKRCNDNDRKKNKSDLSLSNEELALNIEKRYFSIDDLLCETKFNRTEIKFIYRDFKQKCPNGFLNESKLIEIYSEYFSFGDCKLFAKHLFSALLHHSNNNKSNNNNIEESTINFKQFITTLSTILYGTFDEKIKWLFYFYDLDKDGRISYDEIISMITVMYELMGQHVNPPLDETTIKNHFDLVSNRIGQNSLNYEEFRKIFKNHEELLNEMENI